MSEVNEVNGYRYTVAELETVEARTILRNPWREHRRAAEISRAPTDRFRSSGGVLYVPGDAWILHPHQGDLSRVILEAEPAGGGFGGETTGGFGGAIRGTEVNTAPGLVVEDRYRKPSAYQTGVPTDAAVAPTGDPVFKRRPAADGDFSTGASLAADAIAFPPLPMDTHYVSVDRVIAGTLSYPSNCPFAVSFFVPENVPDNLLNFYFGGPTDTDVPGHPGGEFGANFRASGEMVLWERDTAADEWPATPVFRFQAGAPGRGASAIYAFQLIPYARNRIAIFSAQAQTALGQTGFIGAPYGGMGKAHKLGSLYLESKFTSGHHHAAYMTGAGIIRADRARNDRTDLRIARLIYPQTGRLIDHPFMVPYHYPDLTILTLSIEAHLPPGSAINVQLYNAATASPTITDSHDAYHSRFFLTSGQKHYYAIFDFVRGDAGRTPVLFGYTVMMDGAYQTQVAEKVTLQCDQPPGITITDGGTDPAQESAHFVVKDRFGEADALKVRGRYRLRIKTRYDPDDEDLWSTYFLGETAADGIDQIPQMEEGLGLYSAYDVPCTGMWTRVADQVSMDSMLFGIDLTQPAPVKVDGVLTGVGMKIVDILHYLFEHSGWLADERDIDEAKLGDMRILMGKLGSPQEDFEFVKSTKYASAIPKFARDYLDAYVVFDPNAGSLEADGQPRGMWRVLPQPTSPYTVRARFELGPTGSASPAIPVHHHAAYPTMGTAVATFIQRDTYRIRMRPPEGNHVVAVGFGGVISNEQGLYTKRSIMSNFASWHVRADAPLPNPNHRDYLGRCVPILIVDPFAATQQAVDYLCRRVYDRACHATQRHHFRAPLLLITDPTDPHQQRPRPLRAGDAVGVPANLTGGSQIGVIADVKKAILSDASGHWGDYEIVVTNPEGEEA